MGSFMYAKKDHGMLAESKAGKYFSILSIIPLIHYSNLLLALSITVIILI
eukprot:UN24671